jgi:hypothetical protein
LQCHFKCVRNSLARGSQWRTPGEQKSFCKVRLSPLQAPGIAHTCQEYLGWHTGLCILSRALCSIVRFSVGHTWFLLLYYWGPQGHEMQPDGLSFLHRQTQNDFSASRVICRLLLRSFLCLLLFHPLPKEKKVSFNCLQTACLYLSLPLGPRSNESQEKSLPLLPSGFWAWARLGHVMSGVKKSQAEPCSAKASWLPHLKKWGWLGSK